jgi:hypothetical protein
MERARPCCTTGNTGGRAGEQRQPWAGLQIEGDTGMSISVSLPVVLGVLVVILLWRDRPWRK